MLPIFLLGIIPNILITTATQLNHDFLNGDLNTIEEEFKNNVTKLESINERYLRTDEYDNFEHTLPGHYPSITRSDKVDLINNDNLISFKDSYRTYRKPSYYPRRNLTNVAHFPRSNNFRPSNHYGHGYPNHRRVSSGSDRIPIPKFPISYNTVPTINIESTTSGIIKGYSTSILTDDNVGSEIPDTNYGPIITTDIFHEDDNEARDVHIPTIPTIAMSNETTAFQKEYKDTFLGTTESTDISTSHEGTFLNTEDITFKEDEEDSNLAIESTTSNYKFRHNLYPDELTTTSNGISPRKNDFSQEISHNEDVERHLHNSEDQFELTILGEVDVHEAGLIVYLLITICFVLVISLCVVGGYWIKAKCEIKKLDTKMRRACLQGLDQKDVEDRV